MPKEPRRSTRETKPRKVFGKKRVVFEGHGAWLSPYGFTTVPSGTEITIHTGMGTAIDDEIGIRIAKDKPLPTTIPDNGRDQHGDVDTTLGGNSRALSGHRRIYRAGERVPDMILSAPINPVISVQPTSVTVQQDTALSALLKKYIGCSCVWAACTVKI